MDEETKRLLAGTIIMLVILAIVFISYFTGGCRAC